MNSQRLQYLIEHGNIERDRCIQIGKAAEAAMNAHAKSRDMHELAQAMLRCCGTNPDEAAFFRAATDFVLGEKWQANPKDIAVLITCMNLQYKELCKARMPVETSPTNGVRDDAVRTKSAGCLVILGIFGFVSIGIIAVDHLLG
jgi:hypothetical protein